MESTAWISEDELYRYTLARVWDDSLPRLLLCMLNPSTADHQYNDATIIRGVGYARSWGFGRLTVVNMFSYRATNPRRLRSLSKAEAIGSHTNSVIQTHLRKADLALAAWGTNGALFDREAEVLQIARKLDVPWHVLGLTKHGYPVHPLRQRKDLQPVLWEAVNNK